MPRMDGATLVGALEACGRRPGRVLYMSGFADRAFERLQDLPDEVELVRKPFSAAELAGRVRQALDRPTE